MDFSKKMKILDNENMIEVLRDFPQQFSRAIEAGKKWKIPNALKNKKFENVCVQGMGGSGMGGSMLRNLLIEENRIQVEVNNNYELPAMVSKKTLFFAVSYSGNTEETITGFKEAKKRKSEIVAITSNGKLSKMQKNAIMIPQGFHPRTQLAFTCIPMLVVMQRLGLAKKGNELEKTCRFLEKHNSEMESKGKKLALELYNKTPVIYGPKNLETSMLRFHTQIAENSKAFSHWNVFPELTHNELVGYMPRESQLAFVFFRDKRENSKMKNRIRVAREIIRKKSKVVEIHVKGNSLMEKLFYSSLLGDYCSYYLALLYNVDPSPIKNIKYLKRKIRE